MFVSRLGEGQQRVVEETESCRNGCHIAYWLAKRDPHVQPPLSASLGTFRPISSLVIEHAKKSYLRG